MGIVRLHQAMPPSSPAWHHGQLRGAGKIGGERSATFRPGHQAVPRSAAKGVPGRRAPWCAAVPGRSKLHHGQTLL